MDAKHALDDAERRLIDAPDVEPTWRGAERDQALTLLEHVLGRTARDRDTIAPPTLRRFQRLVDRRARGEPVAYIVGWKEFRGLKLTVKPGAFVPRDTSEFLAEQAVRRLRARRPQPVAVDLATGAGPVALAVAHEVRSAEVWGGDISAEALRQARANAAKLRLPVTFVKGDLFAPFPASLRGRVDAITIHPPYVPRHELRLLSTEVRNFEPVHTLTDNSRDGLGLVRRLADEGPDWLRAGGWVLLEVSPDMARSVKTVLSRAGYDEVRSTKGDMDHTRVVVGRT
jgi:release factor glutamine methyltransferase